MGRISATCTGTSGSKYTLYLDYTENSTNVANNTSNITLTQAFYRNDGYASSAYDLSSTACSYSIKVNGTTKVSGSSSYDTRNGRVQSIGSWTGDVTHNSDGSLTITISGSFSISGNSALTGGSVSGSWTLTVIPRATTITTFDNFTIGNDIPVVFDRKSTSFTEDITLYVGNTLVASRNSLNVDSYTLTLSTDEQDIIYNATPSAASIGVTLNCITKSGSTQIGSTQSKPATASVGASIVPSFTSITGVETVTAVSSNVGLYVQNLSRIRFDINGALGNKGSSISSYQIIIDGTAYSGSSVTSGAINKSGNITVTGTVWDTRGRTASQSIVVNLLAYANPLVTGFSMSRCNVDGQANPMGVCAKVVSAGKVASLINSTEKNTLTYTLYSKIRGTSTWSTAKSSTQISGITLSASDVIGTYEPTSSYDWRLDITDKFNTTMSLTVLSTGEVTMSLSTNGIGVGKVWEQGSLDVSGDIYEAGTKLSSKYMSASTYTASDVLAKLKTVDGSGSGIDADLHDGYHAGNASENIPISNGTVCANLNANLLQGNQASAFALASHTHSYLPLSGGMITGNTTFSNNGGSVYIYIGNTSNWITQTSGGSGFRLNAQAWIDMYTNSAAGNYLAFTNSGSGTYGSEASLENHGTRTDQYGQIGGSGNRFYKGYFTSIINTSDRNVKTNVQPYNIYEGYDVLKTLNMFTYNIADKPTIDLYLGTISQDCPYLVVDNALNGEDNTNINLYAYSSLIASAVKVLQEKIEALETDIQTLKGGTV